MGYPILPLQVRRNRCLEMFDGFGNHMDAATGLLFAAALRRNKVIMEVNLGGDTNMIGNKAGTPPLACSIPDCRPINCFMRGFGLLAEFTGVVSHKSVITTLMVSKLIMVCGITVSRRGAPLNAQHSRRSSHLLIWGSLSSQVSSPIKKIVHIRGCCSN